MRTIIAIHGTMGSGKSTAAKHLAKKLHAVVKPFAKPIKDFASILGWNGLKDAKGRRLLQLLGTEVGRECISDNIWIDKWQAALDNTGQNCTVICDDLRFQNEYAHLDKLAKEMPVFLLHIIRPEERVPLLVSIFTSKKRHKSEKGIDFNLDLKPHVIYNSGTISQLQDLIDGHI